MSIYSPKMFIALANNLGGYGKLIEAEDIFVVDTCENIAGRTNTIVFCTNIVTGEKREFSAGIIQQISPILVKSLLEEKLRNVTNHINNMNKVIETFQDISS